MAQAMLSVRVDSEDKSQFEKFCSQTGLNISTCINMFIKAVLREQRLPFEVKVEPSYNERNQNGRHNQNENVNQGRNFGA